MIKKVSLSILFICFAFYASAGTYIVKSGDTLSGILTAEYGNQSAYTISAQIKQVYPDFLLRTGTKMLLNEDKIVIKAAPDKHLVVNFGDNGSIKVRLDRFEQEVMKVIVKGEITTNLFDAVKRIGEDAELAAMLASIFEWEIDFFKDLRPGDKFAVLVEKKFVQNKYIGYGKILAADFYNKNKLNRAIYFEDGKVKGYFNENGRALERGFLRVPLNYARISSRFTDARLHPVFGEVRPHHGVDYAAPIGTPVMATASGTVEKIGYAKGNGNYIALRHSNGYKTYYLHLNGFNRSLKAGSSVNQGQVIGYVGSTGYSTGPHLDYRINHNGTWLNPLKFIAKPITLKKDELERFIAFNEKNGKFLDKVFSGHTEVSFYNSLRMLKF